MQRNTTLSQDLINYSKVERLDRACCRLLANKPILAWLLKAIVPEYAPCSIQTIMEKYLEGTPDIRSIPVDQDARPGNDGHIQGINTVNKSLMEGTVDYDILFTAMLPDTKKTCQIIVNVENQNVWNPGYPLIKRAIYYCGRLLSWQKGTVFQGSDYGKIEKVYSIWICSKPDKAWKNTLTTFSLEPNYLVGDTEYDKIEYELATIAILGLGDSERNRNDILKLLSVLMEPQMETERKKQILETDFAIPMTVEMESEASEMCTLGESIARENLERGIAEGMVKGRTEGQYAIVKRMLKRGRSIQEVVEDTGVSEAEVRKLAEEM